MFQNWIFPTWAFHLLFSQTLPCFHPQVSLGDLEEIMLDATMIIIVKGKEREGKGVNNSKLMTFAKHICSIENRDIWNWILIDTCNCGKLLANAIFVQTIV